jgi:hypothetical protein
MESMWLFITNWEGIMERIVELVGTEWRCDLDEFTTLVSLDKTLLEEELDRLEATGRLNKDMDHAGT